MQRTAQIKITGHTGRAIQIAQDFWLLGTAYDGAQKCKPDELRNEFLACESRAAMESLVRRLGGFFSLVFRHADGRVFAITDRGRTRPLLYVNERGSFTISDEPQELLRVLSAQKLDPLAEAEFATAGFVSGDHTLIEGIQSVGPATILQCDLNGAITAACYREFVPSLAPADPDEFETHIERLEAALRQSVERLLDYAGGRTLILPLSGGVDSRALLASLVAFGYRNIKAFTFGRALSRDYQVGAELAAAARVPFKTITYNKSRWRTVWGDPDFNRYLSYAHGFTSVPNLQAIPALFELRKSGWIEPDAVFVPALAGFFPGGCLPSAATVARIVGHPKDLDGERLEDALMQRHFRTTNLKRIRPELQRRFQERLRSLANAHPSLAAASSAERVILLSEAFEYHERQAKFIGNACRYFDSRGYDWWLPMWDSEFITACESLPVDLRREKQLLKVLTTRLERRYPGMVGAPPAFVANGGFIRNPRLRALTGYFLDPFGQFAVVPFSEWFARVYGRAACGGTVIDVLSQRCLRDVSAMLHSSPG